MSTLEEVLESDELEEIEQQRVELEQAAAKKGIITESDLKLYFRCPYSYYLKKYVGLEKIPLSAFAVQAILFDSHRRKLFNLRDQQIGRLLKFQNFAGPDCLTAVEMTASELDQHLAFEKLGGVLTGKYIDIAKGGHFNGRKIVWAFESQNPIHWEVPEQRMSRKINPLFVGGNHYRKFVLQEGAPVLGSINSVKSFPFEGQKYQVRFPELRPGMLIDDPTLWKFNAYLPEDTATGTLESSSLVTLRILAYCYLAHHYPLHRLKWGVPDELADRWDGVKQHLGPEVQYRHFNCTLDRDKNHEPLTVTTRNNADLDALRKTVELFQAGIAQQEFKPHYRHCHACQYSVPGLNGKIVCDELRDKNKNGGPR